MSMSESSSEPVVKQRPRGRPGPREFEMYRLRVDEGLTLRAIGERFGIGHERVRQLLNANFHMPRRAGRFDDECKGSKHERDGDCTEQEVERRSYKESEEVPVGTLRVPVELVGAVRRGAYEELNLALKEAGSLIEGLDSENPARREQFESLFGRVDSGRELLGVLSVSAGGNVPVEVDIHEHGPTFMHALIARIKFERNRANILDRADPKRGEIKARVRSLEDLLVQAERHEGLMTSGPPGRNLLALAVDAAQADAPPSQEGNGKNE